MNKLTTCGIEGYPVFIFLRNVTRLFSSYGTTISALHRHLSNYNSSNGSRDDHLELLDGIMTQILTDTCSWAQSMVNISSLALYWLLGLKVSVVKYVHNVTKTVLSLFQLSAEIPATAINCSVIPTFRQQQNEANKSHSDYLEMLDAIMNQLLTDTCTLVNTN